MPRLPSLSGLTPQNYNLLVQIVAMVGGLLGVWLIVTLFLWAGGIILSLLLVAGLAATVYRLESRQKRREMWILTGCCGRCGYDLRAATSSICPECGHDVSAEEPTWRKRQREHRLRFGLPGAMGPLPQGTPLPSADLTPAPRLR